jgi:predicted DNA-binding transcriptional regulator YafY
MNLSKLETLKHLHQLIKNKRTGSPNQLAQKLGVCKRTAQNYLEELKNLGAPIKYCYWSASYCYTATWQYPILEINHV